MQNQQIILNITMTPNGVQFVLDQLKKLPIETAGDLYLDIKTQALQQLDALAAMAPADPVPPAPLAPAPESPHNVEYLGESTGKTD